MNVQSCMSSDVKLAAPDQTIREVAQTMREIDAGALPVGENDRLIGMITDRDIAIRAVAAGLPPETKVSEIMSSQIYYCHEEDELSDAARQMAELQVRRLPVIDKDKRLVGILALGDIAQSDQLETSPVGVAITGVSEPGSAGSTA
jgi:CBS domain-containing protein